MAKDSQSTEKKRSLAKQNSSEDEEKPQSRLTRFAKKTNCHAIGDVYNSESSSQRCFWIIALFFFLTMVIAMVACELYCFLIAKPLTSAATVDAETIKLPNVAICDTEGLNLTKLVEEGFSNRTEDLKFIVPPEHIRVGRKKQHDLIHAFMAKKGIKTLNDFITRYAYSCDSTIYDISHFTDEVKLCSPERSWHIHHHYFYNCWVINVDVQKAPGVGAGARIGVNRPFDPVRDAMGMTSEGFAIELFPGHRPYSVNPYMLSYGTANTVSISKKVFRRMQNSRLRGNNLCSMNVEFGGNCQTSCMTNQTYANCGCEWLGMRDPRNFTNPKAPYCSTWEFSKCFENLDMPSLHKCQLACRPLCLETSFRPVITSLRKKNNDGIASFFLGYPVLRTVELEQADSYTLTSLFSNVGGQLGLWLGMSVASIVQGFVLFVSPYKAKKSNSKEPAIIKIQATDVTMRVPPFPPPFYQERVDYSGGNGNWFATDAANNNYHAVIVPYA